MHIAIFSDFLLKWGLAIVKKMRFPLVIPWEVEMDSATELLYINCFLT